MKKSTLALQRGTYTNNTADNKKQLYPSPDELSRVLGQAKALRFQCVGSRIDPNCELKVHLYETPYEGFRASDLIAGGAPFFSSTTMTTLRPVPQTIPGLFSEFVTLVLEVKHSGDAGPVQWDGLVAVTLIIEE